MKLRTESVGGEFFVRTLANLQPETLDAWAANGQNVHVFSGPTLETGKRIEAHIKAQRGGA